ncbi:MAG: glycosyltransferase family 2 protein [Kiritimatiellia bacterium]
MPNSSPSVTVVIPIRNAEPYLPELLPRLLAQTEVQLEEILLLDSMSTDQSREIAARFEKVRLLPIRDFTHGGTRNLGIREAKTEIVVLMTQDASPHSEDWMRKLIDPLSGENTAYTFSRQIPYPGTDPLESYYLEQKFPAMASRTFQAGAEGIRSLDQVFSSNVSSALRRSLALKYPFDDKLIMAEDQQFSRDLQLAGYAVKYVHDSVVMHSHNYSLWQTFRRYFDSVIAINQLFPSHTLSASASEGLRYLRNEFAFLLKNHPLQLPRYLLYLASKTAATVLAHSEQRLPLRMKKFFSMNQAYWKKAQTEKPSAS